MYESNPRLPLYSSRHHHHHNRILCGTNTKKNKIVKPSHLETTTAAVSADSFNSPTTIPDIAANPTSLPTPSGPGIDPPRNISIEKMAQGWVVSWLPPPFDPDSPVASYKVQHREGEGEWIFSESISKDTAYLSMLFISK